MFKASFQNDYSEGAHPDILKTLEKSNYASMVGYGEDPLCEKAKELIREQLGENRDSDIHFVAGGTQANLICLRAMLKPYESVIAATSAHIAVHETGAIEATGHKINTVSTEDGKLRPEDVISVIDAHEDEHMVLPRVIYLSNATEVGTIYHKEELEALHRVAKERDLLLFIDGARMGSALTAGDNDLTLEDLTRLTDVFYIGGTKNGALMGEAILINNASLKKHFRFHIKQTGALMAKGRVLGAQFTGLFQENLFFRLAKHANDRAEELKTGIKEEGYGFLSETTTNQIFPILPVNVVEQLEKHYRFYRWAVVDEKHVALRLVTSWATEKSTIETFLKDLKEIAANA